MHIHLSLYYIMPPCPARNPCFKP